jgi:hypothetical protein
VDRDARHNPDQDQQKIMHAGTAFGGGQGLQKALYASMGQGTQTTRLFGPDVLHFGLPTASVNDVAR